MLAPRASIILAFSYIDSGKRLISAGNGQCRHPQTIEEIYFRQPVITPDKKVLSRNINQGRDLAIFNRALDDD